MMTKEITNTGNRNTGDLNTGDCNTGNRNAGYCNTGNRNTGDCNTGYCNPGHRNTGDLNKGNRNTGDCNTGDWNTGNWNAGNRNAGNWNKGNRNTGYCNTVSPLLTLVFNQECTFEQWENAEKPSWLYFSLVNWVIEEKMTDQEKEDNPLFTATGGYLKKHSYHEAAKFSWDSVDDDDRLKTYNLPNFDADIAQEIFGIDFKSWIDEYNQTQKSTEIKPEIIELNGKKYQLID